MSATFITRLPASGTGLRVAVKDLVDMAGFPTTAGSRVVAEAAEPAAADADCLAGIAAAGAQIIGRTNLHELALGVTGINPWFGTPRNPIDPALVPGGSSSGSAVAVASQEADVGFGTDTGGSIRVPAACCGLAGLKTTWGRISVAGIRPLAPSLDTVGPIAADATGLAAGMRLLEPGFETARCEGRLSVGRFGVPAAPEVAQAVETVLNATSWTVVELDPLPWHTATRAAAIVLSAEAFLANRGLFETFADRLSPDVARRLAAGRRVTAAELSDAVRVRVSWRSRLRKLFQRFDLLVTPTLAILPPRLDQADELLTMRYTLPVNLAGVPAVVLPLPARGRLPASIQLIASWGHEEQLLAAAAVIEAAVG